MRTQSCNVSSRRANPEAGGGSCTKVEFVYPAPMRLSLVFLAIALFCSGLFHLVAAQPAADSRFFPIMAWNWAPNDPAVLDEMRQCGLTVAGFAAPGTLDACRAA